MPHLTRYPGIQLHDLDEARTVLTKHLAHHRIEVVGKNNFRYGIVAVPLDLTTVSRVFSPTPRRIYTGFDDRYYTVCLWNEGASEHLVKGRKFAVGPGQGMVYAPSCETLSVPGNPVSMDAIVIRIPAESVRAEASLLLGPRETEEPFEITLLTRSAASGE